MSDRLDLNWNRPRRQFRKLSKSFGYGSIWVNSHTVFRFLDSRLTESLPVSVLWRWGKGCPCTGSNRLSRPGINIPIRTLSLGPVSQISCVTAVWPDFDSSAPQLVRRQGWLQRDQDCSVFVEGQQSGNVCEICMWNRHACRHYDYMQMNEILPSSFAVSQILENFVHTGWPEWLHYLWSLW